MKKIVLILCFIILIFSGYVYANEKPEENKDNGPAIIEKTEEGYKYKDKLLKSVSSFRTVLSLNEKALDLYNQAAKFKYLGVAFESIVLTLTSSATLCFIVGVGTGAMGVYFLYASLFLIIFSLPAVPIFIYGFVNYIIGRKDAINVYNNNIYEKVKSSELNNNFDLDLFCIRL